MLTSQVLFLAAGLALSLATRQTLTLIGLGLICAGFSVGFGVAMSRALGPFHAARGRRQFGPRHRAGVRFIAVDLARRHHRTQRNEYADRDTHCL